MRRTTWHQETRLMKFEDAYEGWTEQRLTQIDVARLPGVCPRTFLRTINPSAGSGTTDTRKTAWTG